MNQSIDNNNRTSIEGVFCESFVFDHKLYGEKFYTSHIAVQRISGVFDFVPVMISERLMDVSIDHTGVPVKIDGQFRSHNRCENGKNRVILFAFANDVNILNQVGNANQIYLNGFICKKPVYRRTTLGREIADVLLAVNRSYGKTDYIPCICWGRDARFASGFELGTNVEIYGRIQSREYFKQIGDEEFEERTAYEVSISRIDIVEESEENDNESRSKKDL